ncbi:MAG TPA: PH domain-containing protein, partial [Candidatus Micrarchaeota archaeon]|nr:PH domain-containing protein [Candidatus Micrarchaeota archaeon]
DSYALLIVIPFVPIAVYLWQREYYRVYFYNMTASGLEIKKGVFFPNSITIPTEKVSDVYVDQDILDQFFGLYDLHFSSASQSSGNLSHIDGLGKEALDSLKSYLLSYLKSESAGPVGPRPPNMAQPGMGAGQGMDSPAQAAQPEIIATFKPAPVGLWLDYAGLLIGFAVMALFIYWPLIILFPIAAIVLWVYNKKDFASRTYSLRSDGLWLKEGWINPKETLIFYKNVQDIDI